MTAQNGKDMLIKIDMDGSGAYETLAGLGRVNTRVLTTVANEDARAAWTPGDFFGETFQGRMAAP